MPSCKEALTLPDPIMLPNKGWSNPALAMPDEYKSSDPVESYRKYYLNDKASIASWKRRGAPYWWTNS